MKICLDPGHGGSAPGAVHNGLQEKNIVLDICLLARDALLGMGHQVVMTRETDETVTLTGRCEIANFYKAEIFVSVHCNADPDKDLPGMPEAEGEEIWVYKGSNEGFVLAQCLQDEIDNIFPKEPFRGIKESENLYVLKHTHMPAVLIEVAFIDKSSSHESFTRLGTMKKIAHLIAGGIDEYSRKFS